MFQANIGPSGSDSKLHLRTFRRSSIPQLIQTVDRFLNRKRELLALQNPGRKKRIGQCPHHTSVFFVSLSELSLLVVVNVKEIGVKQSLDDSGDNAHRLEGTLEGGFGKIAENPVGDVECPI